MNISRIFSSCITFLKEVRVETKKVDWPSRKQVVRHTIVVLVFCLFVALILGFFDFGFTFLLEQFLL